MSDPYAPPGSHRDPARGGERQRAARRLPPSAPHQQRRPPDADGTLRTARLAMRFSLLVLAGLVALSLPLPWKVGGTAFLLAGGVVGVAALVSAAKARLRATGMVALSLGLCMTLLLVLVQAFQLLFWTAATQRQECLESALTTTALQACQAQYQQDVVDIFPGARG